MKTSQYRVYKSAQYLTTSISLRPKNDNFKAVADVKGKNQLIYKIAGLALISCLLYIPVLKHTWESAYQKTYAALDKTLPY